MRFVSSVSVVLLLLALFIVPCASADTVTGSVSMWYEGRGYTIAGDGTNSVNFYWSRQSWTNGFFYGSSNYSHTTDVAFAGCNVDFSTFDAASLSYTSATLNFFGPNGSMDATGCFIAAHNVNTGHYGLLRMDAFHTIYPNPFRTDDPWPTSAMDATWWFQTNGTGKFGVPEPSSLILLGSGLMALILRLRKR